MALPSSGTMAASMIQKELKESGSWSINSPTSRKLAKVPSGTIKFTDFYGKANTETVTEYVLFKKNYNVREDNSDDRPYDYTFVFDLNIPKNIVFGVLKVKVDISGTVANTSNLTLSRESRVSIPNVISFDIDARSNKNVTKSVDINNFSSGIIKCSGDTGQYYILGGGTEGTMYNKYYKGMNMLITVTFTGEWEPNNL